MVINRMLESDDMTVRCASALAFRTAVLSKNLIKIRVTNVMCDGRRRKDRALFLAPHS
jgi:hypothetical protein